jgi:hypothetical protein
METFDELFRNWDGESKDPMIIPRRAEKHQRDVVERAKSILKWILPRTPTNVRDVVDTSFASRFPRLPVRYWLSPKESTPTMLDLLELWKDKSYRPLTLHEGLDFEEALREMAQHYNASTPRYKRLIGGTHALLSTRREDDDFSPDSFPVFTENARDPGMLLYAVDQWLSDDYLFLLTPLTFEEKDIALPERFRHDPFFTAS